MGRRKRQRQKHRKEENRSSVKKRIEAKRRREIIFGSLIFLGIIVAAVAGGWYLLQPKENPGTLAPDFHLDDLDGNDFHVSDFRGSVVVIDFMSTTCGPCRLSMPELKAVWNDYEDRIVMMSISISAPLFGFDDTEEMLRDWMSEWEATWIHAKDTTGVAILYRATSIPTVVIIDKDGYIRFRHVGLPPLGTISAETISQEIEELS